MANRRIALVAKITLALLSVILASLIAGFALDKYYANKQSAAMQMPPRLGRMFATYHSSDIQYVNPLYLFFFPFDHAKRTAISNEAVTIDESGFRGPGPSQAAGKKLGFLIGGSAAFGYGSSSDATTITGYLNQLQGEYFFVNAGVPSWLTTQELERVAFQLLEHKPAIIVAYNGWNDITNTMGYRFRGKQYDVGTPQNFDRLYELVGDIETSECKQTPKPPWYRRWYPSLSNAWFGEVGDAGGDPTVALSDSLAEQIAHKYAMNMNLMHAMSASVGTRFVGVFQPFYFNPAGGEVDPRMRASPYLRLTSDRIVAQKFNFEYHDFRDVFSRVLGGKVPPPAIEGPDITDATIFIDDVHLADVGNKMIAEQLLPVIRGQP